jgi:hypothetical protein
VPGCVEGTGRFAVELGCTVILVKAATVAYSEVIMRAARQLTSPFCAKAILTTDELIPPCRVTECATALSLIAGEARGFLVRGTRTAKVATARLMGGPA